MTPEGLNATALFEPEPTRLLVGTNQFTAPLLVATEKTFWSVHAK